MKTWTLLVCVSAAALPAQSASPIRVMLLDGQSGGPYYAWQQVTPVLKRV